MAHELCDVKGIIGIILKEGKEKHFFKVGLLI